MGISDFCVFDPGIVRGLAYYTGIVFEIFDPGCELRAIGGGGRYDNLLADFGGPKVTGTGFGMGDCVLEILLEEKGLLDQTNSGSIDYFVAYTDKTLLAKAVEITAVLRSGGKSAEFSYKGGGLGKQLKQASALNAKECIILGAEYIEGNKLVIKDMATGEQREEDSANFLTQF
jgi:histidyl-tRNA synthetase